MPPRCELDTLIMVTVVARNLATVGQVTVGYTALLAGLLRASDARSAGEPWGDALVSGYREALDRYADRYGVARE